MQATHRNGETFALTQAGREALEPSCFKCPLMKSCVIFRTVARFMEAEFPALKDGTPTAPFKAEETAKICTFYVPPSQAGITV